MLNLNNCDGNSNLDSKKLEFYFLFIRLCTCAQSLQSRLTLRAHGPQAPLSVGFSRQEHWNVLPYLPPGDLPDPGIRPPALQADSLLAEPSGSPVYIQVRGVQTQSREGVHSRRPLPRIPQAPSQNPTGPFPESRRPLPPRIPE